MTGHSEHPVRGALSRTRRRGTEVWLFTVCGRDQRRFVAYVLGREGSVSRG